MTRDQLKVIIKECLIEILADGIGDSINEVKTRRPIANATNSNKTSGQMRAHTEQPRRQFSPILDVPALRPQIKEAIKEVARDPIMASIFADTANTTLVNQNNAGHSQDGVVPMPGVAMGDVAQRLAAAAEPEQLFGAEAAGKWAVAAFAPPLRGNRPTLQTRAHDPEFDPYTSNPEIKSA